MLTASLSAFVHTILEQFTPWQIVVSTLTGVYTVRHLDKILGLGCEHVCRFVQIALTDPSCHHTAPEPLARLVSAKVFKVLGQ